MPVTRAVGIVAASPAEVWRTVADPHHLPRWWPRVERVENVDRRGFTQVLRSGRGALVRADFSRGDRLEPRVVSWSQQLEDTPFSSFLSSSETRVVLERQEEEPGSIRTRVTIELEHRLQGKARFGGLLFRRAVRRQLHDALATLRELHGAP